MNPRFLLFAPALLAACAPSAPERADDPPAAPVPASAPSRPAGASATAPAPARAVTLKGETPLIAFSYAWPAEAAAIPALDARYRTDAATRRQRTLNGARQDRAAASKNDFPFHPHSSDTKWTVDGDAAGLLSLRGETYVFSGGAHGNTAWEYILWDRAANRDVTPISLFRDPAAARLLLTAAFCPALDAVRAEKRGEPVTPGPDGGDWMTQCPDLTKQVLVLSDPKAGHFTAVRVLIAPYEAGPYAEGSYEVRLPVTPALAALLKPEHADVLAPPR